MFCKLKSFVVFLRSYINFKLSSFSERLIEFMQAYYYVITL